MCGGNTAYGEDFVLHRMPWNGTTSYWIQYYKRVFLISELCAAHLWIYHSQMLAKWKKIPFLNL